jgi:trans-aconitate 2-methyltransferase
MRSSDWSPEKYLQFQEERSQPAKDLIARAVAGKPQFIVDLGCGPGNSTALLRQAFPRATIVGIDSSPAMIKKAAETLSGVSFQLADVANWQPSSHTDLIFSNALFQWVPSHISELRRILGKLRPGARLAVQLPDNLAEPSHALMAELADLPEWRVKLESAKALRSPLGQPADYHAALKPLCKTLDIHRTTYFHHFGSHADIVDMFSSTGLKPFLDLLSKREQHEYLQLYLAGLRQRYPVLADGSLLFPFPRLFIVATRADI